MEQELKQKQIEEMARICQEHRNTECLVIEKEQEDCGICAWCGERIKNENDIYKVRGDYICRDCVENMYEERED